MKADHTALLLAMRLLFVVYVLCQTLMNANRTTLLLAEELLCAAELFSQSLVLALERINDILGPNAHGLMLITIVRAVLPLIVNLHFMHCFLKQPQPDTRAIGNGRISIGILIALCIIGLLASISMFAIWSFLPDLEANRRRLEKLVFTSLLFDIFTCFGISLASHLLSMRILVAVPPSGIALEASIQESVDLITELRMILGLLLELQHTHIGELVEVVPYLVLVALDTLL